MASPSVPFESIESMNCAQRSLIDILSSARRPDGYCCTTVDFTRAEAFRLERAQQTGVPITLIDLTLRAMALTAVQNEVMKTLVSGYKVYKNATMDIGCSVATDTPVAPIIVFRDADKLSLEEIHFQRLSLTKEAIDEQQNRLDMLEYSMRWLPDFARRLIISRYVNNPKNRRNLGGTIALSAIELPDMEWMCPSHLGGALLLSMGGIKERPMVIDGQVVPRLSALVTFMIDQRVIHPMRAMRVFRRFRRLIESPEKLA